MSSAVLPPLSRRQERWTPAGLFAVIALSACTAPLFTAGGLTLTGDRLLGMASVIAVAAMAITRSLHWTPIHTAVGAFAGIQVLTSLAAASAWPAGPRFAAVYVFGFASFALAAELAARARDPWTGARVWVAIGAILGVVGAGLALTANVWQIDLWGSGHAAMVRGPSCAQIILYAAKITFGEWNLYSSFLLVAFALSLWRWRPGTATPWRYGSGFLALSAIVLGLVFGMTRAAWIGMAALIALWVWARRPGLRPAGALVGLIIVGFAAQAAAIGQTPLYARVIQPLQQGQDRNIEIRRLINVATLEAWRGVPARAESDPSRPSPPRVRDDCQKGQVQTQAAPGNPRAEAPPKAALAGPAAADRGATAAEPVSPAPRAASVEAVPAEPRKVVSDPVEPVATPPTAPAQPSARTTSPWRGQILGNGAGSINALRIVPPGEAPLDKPWNGNMLLFVLHDSGAIGLVSLGGLVAAVALAARGVLRRTVDTSDRALMVALLGAGVVLLFAYQFTHALWLMYPYVYLGLLSAALARTPPGADVPALM